MFYQNELLFLRDIFQRCRIPAAITEKNDLCLRLSTEKTDSLFGTNDVLAQIAETMRPRTVYRLVDSFDRCYRFLLLPDTERPTVFSIGPYLSAPVSEQRLLEIGEMNGISPKMHRYLAEYYLGMPTLSPDSHLFVMFHTFCEKIWKSPSFAIRDVTKRAETPIPYTMKNIEPRDTIVNMKAIERRYAFENEIIQAVTHGQLHMENQLRKVFSDHYFEKRAADPLRNAKNYAIIMNTLLRKAAENGGVHPLHLDRVSSGFALKIENTPSLSENGALMCEMFRTYCRLVRKHTLREYPLVVQKTLLIIDEDLSADLSLNVLAKSQELSLGYLASVFKKATGKTVSEYVRERRMEHAIYLLKTTNLQIQTIALHCGIVDIHYFSKIFKKYTGKTPSEYRLILKHVH